MATPVVFETSPDPPSGMGGYVPVTPGTSAPGEPANGAGATCIGVIGVAIGLVGIVLLGVLLAIVVRHNNNTDHDTGHGSKTISQLVCPVDDDKAVVRDADGCVFSTQELVDVRSDYIDYANNNWFCGFNWVVSCFYTPECDWDSFDGANPFPTWDTNSASAQKGQEIADRMTALIWDANSPLTAAEKIDLHRAFAEHTMPLNLTKMHHWLPTTYDGRWGFTFDVPYCNFVHSIFVPTMAAKPDYAQKANMYMANTLQSMHNMNEYYTESAAAGIVEFGRAADNLYYGAGGQEEITGIPYLLQPICDAMSPGADKDTCMDTLEQIETATQEYRSVIENVWLPACAAHRGDDSPGRAGLPGGSDAAEVWKNHLFGAEPSLASLASDWQRRKTAQRVAVQGLLDTVYPGMTYDEWTVVNGDLDDERTYICFDTPEEVEARWHSLVKGNITDAQAAYTSYQSRERDSVVVDFGEAYTGGSRRSGSWDPDSLLWRMQGFFRVSGFVNQQGKYCTARYPYGLAVHENAHSIHVGVSGRISRCTNDGPVTIPWTGPFTTYFEGFAVWVEGLWVDRTIPFLDGCPECELDMMTGATANMDSMYWGNLFNNFTWDECVASHLADGYASEAAASASCYRSLVSVQRVVYYEGGSILDEMNQQIKLALGDAYDFNHVYKLFSKGAPYEWPFWRLLTNTYIQWRLGEPTAKDMFGYDFITRQVFGNTDVLSFAPCELPYIDDRAGSNPSKLSAASGSALSSAIESFVAAGGPRASERVRALAADAPERLARIRGGGAVSAA